MTSEHTLAGEYSAQIIDNSIICVFNSKLDITYTNDGFNFLTGYKKKELIGTNVLSLKHLNKPDSTHQFIIKTLESGETWKGELQLTHKEQQTIWLDATIIPVDKSNGDRDFIAIFLNITERKKLISNLKQRAHEQALISILGQISLSNIPLKDLIDQILSVTCGSLDIETGIVIKLSSRNSAICCNQYNAELAEEKSVDIAGLLNFLSRKNHIITSESLDTESRFTVPDIFLNNKYKHAIFILIGDKKNPFGILSLLSNNIHTLNTNETDFLKSICNIISQSIIRHNIETSLEFEKELSSKYIDVAEIMIIALDKNERVILSNQKSSSTLGYSKTELSEINFFDTFLPEKLNSIIRLAFHRLFDEKEKTNDTLKLRNNIIPMIDRFGKKRTIKWNSSLLFDEQNHITSVLSAGEDITEILAYEKKQKQLEEKLHQAKKMEALYTLTGGIAHDFNNILSSILGFSDLIIENIGKNDDILHEYIGYIQESGIKARDIIAQLQDINLNQSTQNNSALLPELLKDILKMLRSIFPPDVNIQHNIDDNTPPVYINVETLNQLVLQLLLNARNALTGNGLIKIELSTKKINNICCLFCGENINGEYATISIHDNGTGIDDATLASIFKPSSTSKTPSGLTIAANIIHENNGHFFIERHHNSNAFKTSVHSLFSFVSIEKTLHKHLIVVDDENSVATYLGELLKGAGYKVSVFCDSVEALSAFKSRPETYDLVITDQVMPVITGSELAADMLLIKPAIPIILCTGQSDILNDNKVLKTGIRACLKKPLNSEKLLHLIYSLLMETEKPQARKD